jgi:hypothetical protein
MQVSGGILKDRKGLEVPPEVPPTSFPLRRHTPDHADHRLRALGRGGAARNGRDRDRCGDTGGTQDAAECLGPCGATLVARMTRAQRGVMTFQWP